MFQLCCSCKAIPGAHVGGYNHSSLSCLVLSTCCRAARARIGKDVSFACDDLARPSTVIQHIMAGLAAVLSGACVGMAFMLDQGMHPSMC